MNPWLRRDSVSSISVFPKFQPKLIQTEIAASYWFTMTALILLLQKHEFFSRLKTGIGSTPYSRVHFYLSWSKPLVAWIKNTLNCEESSQVKNSPTHFLYVVASAIWSSAPAMRWIFVECSFSVLVFAVIHSVPHCWCQKLQIVAELWWQWARGGLKSQYCYSFLSPSWWSFSPSSHRSLMITPQVAWVCWLAGWLVQLIPELPLGPTPPPLVRQVMAPQSEVIPLVTNTLHMALHCRVGASHYISAISNHDSDQVESKRGLNHIISRDPFSHLWTHFGPNWLGPLSLSQLINIKLCRQAFLHILIEWLLHTPSGVTPL